MAFFLCYTHQNSLSGTWSKIGWSCDQVMAGFLPIYSIPFWLYRDQHQRSTATCVAALELLTPGAYN